MSKVLAFYIRLSSEDKDKESWDESMSIQNQRALLSSVFESNDGLRGYDTVEFVDDGYTGTNFERPGFKRMMKLVKEGKIQAIMVKDFSRFARNYLDAGEYLEQIFPFLGVRFISVNDNYDSCERKDRAGEWDVVLKNYLYDMYSRDLSKKVRSAIRTRALNGEHLGRAPYGYVKSKTVKNRLEIEPEGAAVVRKIFEMAMEGETVADIVRYLNNKKIPTPGEHYAKINGECGLYKVKGEDFRLWRFNTVRNILINYTYTGACVSHRKSGVAIGSNRLRCLPEDEWIVVPDCHEAIVSKEEFEKVAAGRYSIKGKAAKYQRSKYHILTGYVVCGYCGRNMYFQPRKNSWSYYSCMVSRYLTDVKLSDDMCDDRHYPVGDIEEAILSGIKRLVQLADAERMKTAKAPKTGRAELQAGSESRGRTDGFYHTDAGNLENRLAECREEKVAVYERYVLGEIDRDGYLSGKERIEKKIGEILDELALARERQESLNKLAAGEKERKEKLDTIHRFSDCTEVTKEMLEALVEKVYVFRGRFEVVWKFGDLFGTQDLDS